MTFKLLSIAEDRGQSDRMSAVQESWTTSIGARKLYISVDTKRTLRIELLNGIDYRIEGKFVEFKGLDVDGLIEYLQEVKTFLSEEDMVKELMGKR